MSANPQASLLITNVLLGGLFLFKAIIGIRLHKILIVDIIETVMLFNLLMLSVFSFYNFKEDTTKQTAVAYISTIITFILLLGVIGYHLFLLKRNRQDVANISDDEMEQDAYHLMSVQPIKSTGISHTSIVIAKPEHCEAKNVKAVEGKGD